MPIIKAAKKSLRQSQRRKIRNVRGKKKMKETLKEAQNLISQQKSKEATSLLPKVFEMLDKAAKTGLIKKNTASRKKSRITKAISKLGNK